MVRLMLNPGLWASHETSLEMGRNDKHDNVPILTWAPLIQQGISTPSGWSTPPRTSFLSNKKSHHIESRHFKYEKEIAQEVRSTVRRVFATKCVGCCWGFTGWYFENMFLQHSKLHLIRGLQPRRGGIVGPGTWERSQRNHEKARNKVLNINAAAYSIWNGARP